MGEAKRRKQLSLHVPQMLGDVRKLSERQRQAYIVTTLERAEKIAAEIPDGKKLYAVFEPMFRFVVSRLYFASCHDTSAVMYMQMCQEGLPKGCMTLCIGEVNVAGGRFDHSWVEVNGQIFDVAICAPGATGVFAGGAVFADIDLGTNAPVQAKFGVASQDPLETDAAQVYSMTLHQYLDFQRSKDFKPMTDLAQEIYGGNGQELLEKYGNMTRKWRNPLLNPQEIDI